MGVLAFGADMYGAQRALWDRDEIKQAGAPLREDRGMSYMYALLYVCHNSCQDGPPHSFCACLYECLICVPYTCALYVCLTPLPGKIVHRTLAAYVLPHSHHVHALYVCLIRMPYMYAFYAYQAKWSAALSLRTTPCWHAPR